MCKTCQACVRHVQEVVRKLQIGQARTPEELRKLENTISGFKEYSATKLPSKPAEANVLQGGGIDQELARQAMFGYARNRAGDTVPIEKVALEEMRDVAQAAAGNRCPSCSCDWGPA